MELCASILIVDDDPGLCDSLGGLLRHAGFTVRSALTGRQALDTVADRPTDLVFLDLRLGDESGLDLLPQLKTLRPEMAVLMITAMGTIEDAVEAMRRGADNFVTKPLDPARLLALVAKGLEAREFRHKSARLERLSTAEPPEIVSRSPAMRRALALAVAAAPHDTTVLLLGETGTGKGRLARSIHAASSRRSAPFVELNCAGLQRELTESELFGHERGAFTGAANRKIGLFEAAQGGTLLLDEIGEMDLAVQAKLLQVLETRRFRRVGGVTEIGADVRVLAATHRDLVRDATEGRFREDLLYRLNVFPVSIPPLRERKEDILTLASGFLREFGARNGGPRAISEDAAMLLVAHRWPGNVRELRNMMERAAIVCPPDAAVAPSHLPPLRYERESAPGTTMDDAERSAVERALADQDGNLVAAARQLGVSRGTLYRKMRKFGIAARDPEGEGGAM
jgi:DNA-binding NtrC family response regulator